jgi:hypothetical protein
MYIQFPLYNILVKQTKEMLIKRIHWPLGFKYDILDRSFMLCL